METTATNKRLRELLTGITDKTLVPRPEFQRRLVWVSRHKVAFIKTVLEGLPFPEIYIAAGEVDLTTGTGTTLLVDGQQRISTLHEYFHGSTELKLNGEIKPYAQLESDQKKKFLEYAVVVRDLGAIDLAQIKEVFRRINSTQYSLNAMEINNARFDGELKSLSDRLSRIDLFEDSKFFGPTEIRRMGDMRFVLSLLITMISLYFNRDDALEEYLEKFNDEFPEAEDLEKRFRRVASFVRDCNFPSSSRFWKKADFFTGFIEIDHLINVKKRDINPLEVKDKLSSFYHDVDGTDEGGEKSEAVTKYARAALQGSNDRANRITRGLVVRSVIDPSPIQKSVLKAAL